MENENFKHCPRCYEDEGLTIPITRIQFEQESYWVSCTNEDCYFLEQFAGKLIVSEEVLKEYGLPAELLQHMEIYSEDINKIIRICMSECMKKKLTHLQSVIEAKDIAVKSFIKHHNMENPMLAAELHRGWDVYNAIKKTAEDTIADIPIDYLEKIKIAFSKIEGYDFPEQYTKDNPLGKFDKALEEEAKELGIKSK